MVDSSFFHNFPATSGVVSGPQLDVNCRMFNFCPVHQEINSFDEMGQDPPKSCTCLTKDDLSWVGDQRYWTYVRIYQVLVEHVLHLCLEPQGAGVVNCLALLGTHPSNRDVCLLCGVSPFFVVSNLWRPMWLSIVVRDVSSHETKASVSTCSFFAGFLHKLPGIGHA